MDDDEKALLREANEIRAREIELAHQWSEARMARIRLAAAAAAAAAAAVLLVMLLRPLDLPWDWAIRAASGLSAFLCAGAGMNSAGEPAATRYGVGMVACVFVFALTF